MAASAALALRLLAFALTHGFCTCIAEAGREAASAALALCLLPFRAHGGRVRLGTL